MSNGKKIVYATPDELIYEPTKTVLERTWDKLASHYSSIIEPNTFQKMNTKLLQAKVELETNNTVYDLLQKDVIKPEKINYTLQNIDYNLVKKGIQDCKKIVSTKIDLLDKAIKKEAEMSKLMKDNDYCIIDGLVNVFVDSNYIVYDDKFIYPVKWKPIGLCCTIKYNGIVFMASVEPELYNDDIEQVTEYTKEINSECNEEWKRLEIMVERKEVNESDGDEIAKFVIKKRKQGMKMVDLQEMVICYLSRVFVKDFGDNDNFVNGVGKKMIDGLTKEFFCLVDDQVIRVVRKEGKIEMYLDEQLVDIEKKQE